MAENKPVQNVQGLRHAAVQIRQCLDHLQKAKIALNEAINALKLSTVDTASFETLATYLDQVSEKLRLALQKITAVLPASKSPTIKITEEKTDLASWWTPKMTVMAILGLFSGGGVLWLAWIFFRYFFGR